MFSYCGNLKLGRRFHAPVESLLSWGQFQAGQKELLTGTFCLLVDFSGYQPNFHTKCMHFGW